MTGIPGGMLADTITNEAEVPPYTLPDPLVCQDGSPVTDARTWRDKRRPELLRLFESEQYGRTLLGRPQELRFVLRDEKKDARGGKATRLRVGVLFEGTGEGRQMELLVYLPNHVRRPVPVFLGLNFDGNYTTTDEPDIPLAKHFAMGLYANKLVDNTPTEAGRGIHREMWPYDLVLERGYGVACRDWPAPGRLVDSRIGYFLREGKHDVTREDWRAMLAFADKHLPE